MKILVLYGPDSYAKSSYVEKLEGGGLFLQTIEEEHDLFVPHEHISNLSYIFVCQYVSQVPVAYRFHADYRYFPLSIEFGPHESRASKIFSLFSGGTDLVSCWS